MCGGGGGSRKKKEKPAAPPTPQIVKDMVRATDLGPTGYTPAMRKNLGMDIQMGGAKPVSGMTGSAPAFTGYTPVAAKPDPLMEILAPAPLPVHSTPIPAPATPTPTRSALDDRLAQLGYQRGAGNRRGDRQR